MMEISDDLQKRSAARQLQRMRLEFGINGFHFKTYWCMVIANDPENFNRKEHSHSFIELHIGLSGKSVVVVNGEKFILEPSKVLALPPNTKHRIISQSGDFSKMVWGVSVTAEGTSEKALQLFESHMQEVQLRPIGQEALHAIDFMLENVMKRPYQYYQMIQLRLYIVFVEVLRCFFNSETEKENVEQNDVRIEAIRKFIYDNIGIGLNCSDVAEQFNISTRQLSRMLQGTLNMSLGELKKTIQHRKICEYLAGSDASLKEIAKKTGFADEFAMGHFFKRREGIPPGQYRKNIRRKNKS